MGDISDKTQDVNIWNDEYTKKVSVITDGSIERLAVDSSGNTSSAVQAGNAFFLTSGNPLTVASGTNYDVMIVTGTTKEIHLKDISVNVLKNAAAGNTQFQLFEGITVSANGTALTVFNNNRRSSMAADFVSYHSPTVTGTGTQLLGYLTHNDWETYIAPSYTNTWEIILKTNAKYLLRFYNNTNQSNTFTYLYWLFQDAI